MLGKKKKNKRIEFKEEDLEDEEDSEESEEDDLEEDLEDEEDSEEREPKKQKQEITVSELLDAVQGNIFRAQDLLLKLRKGTGL